MKRYIKASSDGYSKDVEYVFKEGVKQLRSYGYKVSIKNNGIGLFSPEDDYMQFDYVDQVKQEISDALNSDRYDVEYDIEDLVEEFSSFVDDFEFGISMACEVPEYLEAKRECKLKYQQVTTKRSDNYETVVDLVNTILEDCEITKEFDPNRCIKVKNNNHFIVNYGDSYCSFTLYFWMACKEKFVTEDVRAAFECLQMAVSNDDSSWADYNDNGTFYTCGREYYVEHHPEIADRLNVPVSQLVKELRKLSKVWIKNIKEYLATYNTDKYEVRLNRSRNLEVTFY
jgi:hypothetical protein